MTTIMTWRDHIAEARHLLALGQALDTDQAHTKSYLYEAVVQITQALIKLETRDDD